MTTITVAQAVRHMMKFATALLGVFLWQLFSDGLQVDIQLINRFRLRLEFMVLFQHGAPYVIVQRVLIWRVWGPLSLQVQRYKKINLLTYFSMNAGQFACSQFCVTLKTLRNGGCLG